MGSLYKEVQTGVPFIPAPGAIATGAGREGGLSSSSCSLCSCCPVPGSRHSHWPLDSFWVDLVLIQKCPFSPMWSLCCILTGEWFAEESLPRRVAPFWCWSLAKRFPYLTFSIWQHTALTFRAMAQPEGAAGLGGLLFLCLRTSFMGR